MASADKTHLQTRQPDSNIEFAGDYFLKYIHLRNHAGKGIKTSVGESLKGENININVIEFNIYESIFSSSVTGSAIIADTQNLIGNLPIQGTERICFKLSVLGDTHPENTIDCSEATGHPMHIYKLTNKQQLNDHTQSYTLHFASREFVRNLRTRVSKSFSGKMDEAVNSIFADPDYLDSRKVLHKQPTRNQDKVCIPNLTPFDAIGLLAKRSLPEKTEGAGYLFYETTKGFHFRSWESLCVDEVGQPKDPIQKFRYVQVPVDRLGHEVLKDGEPLDSVIEGYMNVENYKFLNNFHDVAANTALGTYGHRVITHNIFDKSYRADDFNYHNTFYKTKHTDKNPAVTDSPVDYDVLEGAAGYNKGVSDYPESRVTVQATTQYAHGEDTGNYGIDVSKDGALEGQRISQINQIHSGTRLQMTIKGQSWLQPGDLIQFDVLSVENREHRATLVDPLYSGRYIITHIRHRVAVDQYIQVLECVKDGVASSIGSSHKSYTEIAREQPSHKAPVDIA
jgi:hypothetical protein